MSCYFKQASPLVEEIAEIHSEEKENLSENVEEVEEDVEVLQGEVIDHSY